MQVKEKMTDRFFLTEKFMNISSHRTIRLGQVIFLLMFPFLIAACSGLSLSEENPDSTDVSYLKNLQTLVKNEGRNDLGVYLSPDGNWLNISIRCINRDFNENRSDRRSTIRFD